MKRTRFILSVAFLLCFASTCQQQAEQVERYIEDGVEVIVNHVEPYKIRGEPSSLILEETFTIDTERDDVAENGLTDIYNFDVDSEGNLYFLNRKSGEDFVFKFDHKGNFVTSFGRKGQGPGEIMDPYYLRVDFQDDIIITDIMRKTISFGKDGNFKKGIKSDQSLIQVLPLENGNYLGINIEFDPNTGLRQWPLCIFDPDFQQIKELDKYTWPDYRHGQKRAFPFHRLVQCVSDGNIYVGNTEQGYEIQVFDLEGNLKRKIKKEFQPVKVTEKMKTDTLEAVRNPSAWLERNFFLTSYPPFQNFFTDDEGHLFVMTPEESEKPGEYMYDVFNPDGIFVSRISLGNTIWLSVVGIKFATAKNLRLYCLIEKENAYKELVVYRMMWK